MIRVAGAALFAVLVAAWLTGCGAASTNVVGPSANKCQVTVSTGTTSFPAAGATGSVAVNTDRECSWNATSAAAWITFTSSSTGQGSASVSFSVAANPAASARSASLQVNDKDVQLSQAGAPCRFDLDRTSETMSAAGGSDSVVVSTLAGCSWSASSSASWVSVQGSASGSGRATFTVAANSGPARSTALTIAGQSFTLAQQAAVPTGPVPAPAPPPTPAPTPAPPPPPTPTPDPPPAPCTYSISPQSGSLPATGGTVSISVNAGNGCAWTSNSNSSWLTITAGDGGSGNGTVIANGAPNTGAAARTGTLTIAGQSYVVTQDGLPTVTVSGVVSALSGGCPSLTFVVGPAGDVNGSAGGTTVTTNSGTRFTAGKCSDVSNGAVVQVTGVQGTDGRVTAASVQIQKKPKG